MLVSSLSHLDLKDCVITGIVADSSLAASWGGGLFADSGSVLLVDCTPPARMQT